MQSMYDRLGSLLSEALETGEFPAQKESSPLSSNFFGFGTEKNSAGGEKSYSEPKVKVFTFRNEQRRNHENPQKFSSQNTFRPQKRQNPYQIIRNAVPQEVKSALSFLGIPESASFDEAKKIYREKLMYYHPDRRADNPVLQKIAKEKTARLLKEWEKIEVWYEKR